MSNPTNLKYTKSHEWVELTGENTARVGARVGLTDFAQKSLGGIVFVNLPQIGDELIAGGNLGDVESVKAVSDIVSPFTCTVTEINEELLDSPGNINDAPYDAWLVDVSDITAKEELLDVADYEAFCAENG